MSYLQLMPSIGKNADLGTFSQTQYNKIERLVLLFSLRACEFTDFLRMNFEISGEIKNTIIPKKVGRYDNLISDEFHLGLPLLEVRDEGEYILVNR